MRLENSFEVPAPPATAWTLLNDVPRVIPCMPGAALDEIVDENTFKVTMRVKFGPIALQFATEIVRQETDEDSGRTVLTAKARETKGRGGASATIESTLEPSDAGSRVTIVTDLSLQGTVASTGRGMVGDVANQITNRFADCIASKLREQPAPAASSESSGASGSSGPAAGAGDGAHDHHEHHHHHLHPPTLGGGGLLLRALFRPLLRRIGRS
jgi:uncharacterized protein